MIRILSFSLVLLLAATCFGEKVKHANTPEGRLAKAEERMKEEGSSSETKQAVAEALYFVGAAGNGKAVKRAEKLFTELHEADAEAAQPKAYLGSIKLLRSSTTWALWEKEKLARSGLQMLDDAVEAAPEDPEVRFVRAITTFNVPDWFQRSEQSAEDFELLANGADAAVEAGRLEPWLAAAALFHHGRWLEKAGNVEGAKQAYRRAVAFAPNSQSGIEAQAILEYLADPERGG